MVSKLLYLPVFIVLMFILLSQVIFADGIAPVEVTSLRNANTRVWQNTRIEPEIDLVTGIPTQSQRTTVRYVYEKADGLNYNASTGKRPDWRPTNEAFQAVQDANYPYQVNQGPYQIKFNNNVTATFPITYQINGETMQLGLRELAFYNPKTQTLTPLQSFQRSAPTVTGNKIRYSNAFSGIDVEYVYTKNRFQQNLIAQSLEAIPNPSQYGLSSTDAYLVSVTEINLDNFPSLIKNHKGEGFTNNLLSGENGEILFHDTSSNKPICQFSLSQAIDNKHQQKSMYKHLMQLNGNYYLVEGVPYSWLQSAQYPVVLDYELKTGTSGVNEVWKSGNTYFISGEYTIGNGYTLVIEPGTVCKFSTGCRITAGTNARIIAKGEAYNYILFTSWKDAANGETLSTTYFTPSAGDYSIALYLPPNSSPSTRIEYCKIAYAEYGIDIQTRLDYPIQNNILRNQQIADFWVTKQGSTIGVTIQNNLIVSRNASYGIYLDNWYSYATIYNNTIDGQNYGIAAGGDSPVADCKNNLISSCSVSALFTNDSFGNHSYNRFYNNNNNYENVDVGDNESSLTQNPYVFSANGSYYLNQTNTDVINAGDTTVPSYLRKKTTTAPNWVIADITTSQTWSKVPRDTGKVDIGFHYDPVDYVIGTTNKMLITVDNSTTPVQLTILPGVVVSFWRNVTSYNGQLMINYGDIIAHGHADERIIFNSIYATGDGITYALGTNSFSYYAAIRLGGSINGMESQIQNCEFHNGTAGITIEFVQTIPCYRLISDNIFKDCVNGVAVFDAFARIYNNLFIGGNNGIYTVYIGDNGQSNDSCYIWNNTMVGNYHSQKGIYAHHTSGSNDVVDIRNNIITGFKEHGILIESNYTGNISYNCLYNNATNYSGSISAISTLNKNPQFATKGNGLANDDYYLAQTTGNVSHIPFRNNNLSNITLSSNLNNYYFQVQVFATDHVDGLGNSLGNYYIENGYTDGVSDHAGNLLIRILADPDFVEITPGDYIDLQFASGDTVRIYLPAMVIYYAAEPEQLNLWLASDGATYYARSDHGKGALNQDAEYAMNYDTAGLAASSYIGLGTSPCVNAGDTTIRAYGSTHTALTKNSQRVDIGYHPMNRGIIQVSEIGRLFEYEDGTPFIPIGGNPYCPQIFTNQIDFTWSKVSEYFNWYSAHGLNNIAIGGCSFSPDKYKHFSNENDWKSFQKPIGIFQADMFQEFSKLLNYADVNNLTYYLGVFRTYHSSTNYLLANPESQYNIWYGGSEIFYKDSQFTGVSSPLQVLSSNNAYATQTNTLQYYIDQWGNREGIFYWEPMIEINYVGDGGLSGYDNTTIKSNWISNIIDFMHKYEIQKYGRKHLVSISSGLANPTEIGYDCLNNIKYSSEVNGRVIRALDYAPNDWFDTTKTQKYFYNHPKLDFVSIHPIIGDSTHWVTNFPLQSLATVGGTNSLWYDKTSSQWLVDSAVQIATLAIHSAVNMGLSLMTGNIPYLNTEQGPDNYNAPWVLDDSYGDLYTTGTCLTDRHISENLHRAMNHFGLYAHMLSGGGGPGIMYGFQAFNWAVPSNTEQQCCYTTKYSDVYFINNYYPNPLEYNILNDNMFIDQLGLYKVVTSFNWSGLKYWYNQNTSGRITLTSDTGCGVIPFYSGDTDNLMIWLLRDTWAYPTGSSYETSLVPLQTVMSVTGFNSGYQYRIIWYNPWTGESLGSSTFIGPSASVTAPQYVRDIIAIIKPEENN